ncbi:TetR family transcriptional regulator [Variovorax paradoxus]|nr:TetR family transcriptional regulator [Variovorax paradoxus]
MPDRTRTAASTRGPAAQPSLRERTRDAMRAEVIEVAFRLFAEQGFDKTTVEQIAAQAGLSRTTFFRYFGTKDEIVLGKFAELGQGLAAALAARPARERPWVSLRRAFDLITVASADDTEQALKLMRLLGEACALMTRNWEKAQGWQSQLAPEIARRLGAGADHPDDPRAPALVASAIACLDAATDAWTAGNGSTPLSVLLDRAMGALGPVGT